VNELSLFAGAGGGILGGLLLGWTTVCAISLSGTTFSIDFSMYQPKMCAWTKNTDTEKGVNALSAERNSSRETRGANNTAARTPAVVFFKQGRRLAPAPSAGKNFYHLALVTKHAPAHAERFFAYLAESSIQWSRCETGLPFSVAHSLRDVCEIKRTGRRRFSGILLRNCGRILSRISSMECHGATTEKEEANGA